MGKDVLNGHEQSQAKQCPSCDPALGPAGELSIDVTLDPGPFLFCLGHCSSPGPRQSSPPDFLLCLLVIAR